MFNEERTVVFLLNKLKIALTNVNYEVVIVDDGSTDQSAQLVKNFASANPKLPVHYIYQENQGKGAAIRTAMDKACGEIYVVQDADLEYDPSDLIPLLDLFSKGEKVVYGSRNLVHKNRDHSTLLFYFGGLLVTWTTNLLFRSNLTDEATCYKLFHADVLKEISFKNNDFAWEPEITAKILKRKINIAEHPISYHPRSLEEGKKISWKDGVKAIYVLICEFVKR